MPITSAVNAVGQPTIKVPSDRKDYTWNENSQSWLEITGE